MIFGNVPTRYKQYNKQHKEIHKGCIRHSIVTEYSQKMIFAFSIFNYLTSWIRFETIEQILEPIHDEADFASK